ncbi:LptF/LptG family permease [Candidatus Pelagibacter sp. HIMB1485]|uniref:LptF/LptG family permease n=1 Tax=Candidatus Pelagibacter sp. HIMB1485 TaxID=3415415 RepID=UPI003F84A193
MKVYIKFIIINFLKSLLFVSTIIFCLIFILNLLTEFEFFREIEVKYYFPIYLSLLNSPGLIFEMFPFIFLISSQLCLINLLKNDQIQTLKYSGLKNTKVLFILLLTTFLTGIIIVILFYNLSSNLKNIYLNLKNNYTADDKYLAVITNNGLWIKDNINGKINIINANKIDNKFLNDVSITVLDRKFNVKKHIETKKIDISKNEWIIFEGSTYEENEKKEFDSNIFLSNFDYERIQSLFSNLSSLTILELYQLKKNYDHLNLSTTEIRLQIQKILSYPVYLTLMTLLSFIIMFYSQKNKSNTLKISFGIFLSVMIYYMNNFFHVLGKTEKINITLSVWIPMITILIISSIYTTKINEK